MKKIIIPIALSVASLCASNTIQNNIIDTSGDGKSNVNVIDGKFHNLKKEEKDYTKEILLNYVLQREPIAFKTIESSKAEFVAVVEKPKDSELGKQDETTKLVSVRGYCLVEETVDVGKQPMSSNLNCNTNIGAIKFFGNYVPYNELESLFVTALHIEKNGKKYKVENAKILNESRSSYNVATYVNNRKLERIALESTGRASDTIRTGANDYLDQLEASKQEQVASNGTGTIDNSGSGTVITQPVVTTNTQPPEAQDYIVKGAIDIVAGTVKAITDVYKADLPYLYQIVGESKIYVDLYVNPNEMSLDTTIDNNINNKNYTTLQQGKK